MKICSSCKKQKQFEDFRRDNRKKDKSTAKCKECLRKNEHSRYRLNDLTRKSNRSLQLQKTYGMSYEEFHNLYEQQLGCCAICKTSLVLLGTTETKYKVACVDHNHITGKVRGLLCNKCNRALGLFKDNITILKLAAEYLEKEDANE